MVLHCVNRRWHFFLLLAGPFFEVSHLGLAIEEMLASLENHFLEFGELLTQVLSIKPVRVEPSVAVVKNRVQFVRNVFNAIVDCFFHL